MQSVMVMQRITGYMEYSVDPQKPASLELHCFPKSII